MAKKTPWPWYLTIATLCFLTASLSAPSWQPLHAQPATQPAAELPAKPSATAQPAVSKPVSPVSLSVSALLAAQVTDTQLEGYRRAAAARHLLDMDNPAASAVVLDVLADTQDPTSQRIMLLAIADATNPASGFGSTILKTLDRIDASVVESAALALGRYDNHWLLGELIKLAKSKKAPLVARRTAVLALSHHHTQAVAKLLLKLAEDAESAPLRQMAYTALGHLACQPELGEDATAWRQWWDENGSLSPASWDAMILAKLGQRSSRFERQSNLVVSRLVDAQRQLLRLTPRDQRTAMLGAMLDDALEPVRQLAIDQLDQRARSGDSIDTTLREGLLRRLDDPSAAVRLASVKLLRNLRDENGSRARIAQVAADRLISFSNLHEDDEQVLRTYLLILTDTPVAKAVDREIDLLRDPALRQDAAGAISSAIDQNLVSPADMKLLKIMFVRLAPDGRRAAPPPEPKIIELLGRVGNEPDWRRIAQWLKSSDEQVALAAARAWAQSDRPLSGLAPYADSSAILPILIDAAYKRGRSTTTLMALIHHKPSQAQLAQSWQAALTAMAGRMAPSQVITADAQLAKQGESMSLRAAFVGAAVTAAENQLPALTTEPATTQAAVVPLPVALRPMTTLVDLYLLDARLLLNAGSAETAMRLLDKVQQRGWTLSESQVGKFGEMRLDILAAMGDLDRAIAQADTILKRLSSLPAASKATSVSPVIAQFLSWTDRSITTRQFDQAQRIIAYLQTSFTGLIPQEQQTRLASLQTAVQTGLLPATTQPATTTTTTAATKTTTETAAKTVEPSTSPAASNQMPPATQPASGAGPPAAATSTSSPAVTPGSSAAQP